MIIRAKTKDLFEGRPLSKEQLVNSESNMVEIENNATILKSLPRRLVFELTNTCNLKCVMCGRNVTDFNPTMLKMEWFDYFVPFFNTVEEVTLMGWGEPTIHPNFVKMLSIIDKHNARKYFCTNGMTLDKIKAAIFEYSVDVFSISVDGAVPQTNDKIRQGSNFVKIISDLKEIVKERNSNGLKYPHINFVFCAMKSNLNELAKLVELAADIGIEEVKVVYMTAFNSAFANEVLWDLKDEIKREFDKAMINADIYNILLKLPFVPGEDPAANSSHRECFAVYRDLFISSDGFIRPCMSSAHKFFPLNINTGISEIWNSPNHQAYRKVTNNEKKMFDPCKRCFQSSHCNWNKKESFIQSGNKFSPIWESETVK